MGSLDKKQNYKKIAKEVIQLEINALKKLKNSITGSFNEAVDVISKCQSKVILCGVGKSGLIAAKISATLLFSWNSLFLSLCKRLFTWRSWQYF